MTEPGNGHFDRLAEGLSAEQRSEFFQALHEADITAHDLELARLLRVLQLYKAYYESIPLAVQTAAGDISRLKQEIAALSSCCHPTGRQLFPRSPGRSSLKLNTSKVNWRGSICMWKPPFEKSAQTLATRMAALLHSRIDETVLAPLHQQLTDLVAANQALDQAIEKSKTAAAGMQKHAAVARQIHLSGYALASLVIAIVLVAGSWLFIRSSYAQQMQHERLALVRDNEKNRQVLLKLAESGRTLELRQDPKRPQTEFLVYERCLRLGV